VPTAWLSWLTPGDALSIDVEELGREVPLVLRRLAARADPVSQSVKAIADVVDPGEGLIAGMSGTLRIAIPAQPVTQRGNADE
jgi:membrane fusion protein (multidrug efflux system)